MAKLNNAPESGARSDDLIDKVVVVTENKGREAVTTDAFGEREATRVDVLVLAGFPGEEELEPLGDVLIFWQVVQDQIAKATLPVAGKITRHGRAYRLDPLAPEVLAQVEGLL